MKLRNIVAALTLAVGSLGFAAVGQADAELSREDDAEAVARRAGGESRRAFRDVDGVHQRGSARDDRLVAALEQLAASEEWLELCVARGRRNLVRLSALAQVGPPLAAQERSRGCHRCQKSNVVRRRCAYLP